jgi:hypothetical protein
MHLQFHNLTTKNAVLEAKLNNVDKQTKGLMGFEPPSRTIHSITRQRQCDHNYCAPAFSQKAAFVIVLHPIQNIPDEGHYSFRKKWDLL